MPQSLSGPLPLFVPRLTHSVSSKGRHLLSPLLMIAAMLWGGDSLKGVTVEFTTPTTITEGDTTYENYDITVTNTTLTVEGDHTFGDVSVSGGALDCHGSVLNLSSALLSGSHLHLRGGGRLNVTGSLDLTSNSVLAVYSKNRDGQVAGGWEGVGVTVTAGSMTVELGSSVNANATGYAGAANASGNGPGGGNPAGGGGHGGNGGPTIGGPSYGSCLYPLDLGSAGGSASGEVSGAGGGAIKIVVGTTLSLDGVISADGQGMYSYSAGPGAGGSIWVEVHSLAGTGSIRANGGGNRGGARSGGGGRVAIHYSGDLLLPVANVSAHAGWEYDWLKGEDGSVVFVDTSSGNLDAFTHSGFDVSPGDTLTVDSLVLHAGTSRLGGGGTIDVSGDMNVLDGAVLKVKSRDLDPIEPGRAGGTWVGVGGTVEATRLAIATGGRLHADGQGYPGTLDDMGRGPGAGEPGGGGGHGGHGGRTTGGMPYGSSLESVTLGSSGGGNGGQWSGAGGGAIRINVQILTLDGVISADGVGVSEHAGAGSGGSVWIEVTSMSGSGSVRANGGGTGGNRGGGGGAGGRIAVHYSDSLSLPGENIAANGGWGPSGIGESGTVALVETSGPGRHLHVYSSFSVGEGETLEIEAVTLHNGTTLLRGGSRFMVDGTLALENSAKLVARSWQTGAQIDGQWLGEGVKVRAGTVTIAPDATLSADGQGYVGALAAPGLGPGGGPLATGAGHGGYGARTTWGTRGVPYGMAEYPVQPGSGGGGATPDVTGGPGGGAIWLEAELLHLDGSITASATRAPDRMGAAGGSGGSILLDVGSLTGTGHVTAAGGYANVNWGGTGGAGGRIAIYHRDAMILPEESITTPGATGVYTSGRADAGTVVISDAPAFVWLRPRTTLVHGVKELWAGALGVGTRGLLAELSIVGPDGTTVLAEGLGFGEVFPWDTNAVPDGIYELRATFENGDRAVTIGEAVQTIAVNNTAIWHGGEIGGDEIWDAGAVHIVESDVRVPAGATLTVGAGAVVKFLDGTRLSIADTGVLDAIGTDADPIVFTSLFDDTAGGDTNLDGDDSHPLPGQWRGFDVAAGGTLDLNEYVDVRYSWLEHHGVISADATWSAMYLHHVTGEVTIPNAVSLTVEPGAVIKFEEGAGITTEVGGAISAVGTGAQPIAFTAIRDDEIGGDANGDGDGTVPAAGDWRSIRLYGAGSVFEYVRFRYGGNSVINQHSAGGMVEISNTAATFANCVFEESIKEGVLGAGITDLTNCLILNNDRGVNSFPGATTDVINCTVDGNRVGLLGHAGTLNIHNSIVTNSLESGVINDLAPDLITITYSNVWNPGATAGDYVGTPDQTGVDGNISADPRYRGREQDIYQLGYKSPCIDAADGTRAPAMDFLGAPRYDDPRTEPNTGVPTTPGGTVCPDIGAYEFAESAPSDLDLVVTQVNGPTSGVQGDRVRIEWTGRNDGTATATGSWHDAVYLSTDTVWTADDILLGDSLHSGDVLPGRTYTMSATVTLPGVLPGDYRYIVRCNSDNAVFEGINASNNARASSATVAMDLPALALGVPVQGQLSESWAMMLYKVDVPVGDDLKVVLDGPEGTVNELYVRHGNVPTRDQFDARGIRMGDPDQRCILSGTAGGIHYVMVYGVAGTFPADFTLSASLAEFAIDRVRPDTGSNQGRVTITVFGAKFAPDSEVRLIDSSRGALSPTATYFTNSGEISATFDLTAAAIGPADVQVLNSGRVATTLPGAFTIEEGEPGRLETNVVAPERVRVGRVFEILVSYSNVGGADLLAPIMRLQSGGATQLSFSPNMSNSDTGLDIVGVGPAPPAGILPPGVGNTLTVYAVTSAQGIDTYELYIGGYPGDIFIEWADVEPAVRPQEVPDDTWDPLFAGFQAATGDTWASYHAMVSENATLFPTIRPYNYSLYEVVQQEFEEAFALVNDSISGTLVHDQTGVPLPNVRIDLYDPETEQPYSTFTGTDGAFLFPYVLPGTYEVSYDGFLPVDPLTLEPGGRLDLAGVVLRANPGGTISGRVVAELGGMPIADMVVAVTDEEGFPYVTRSDAEGGYLIDSLPAGTYEMEAGGDVYARYLRTGIGLASGEAKADINLALSPGATISGTVTGPEGPVADAFVGAVDSESLGAGTVTDEDGTYTITGLPAGVYGVSALADGLLQERIDGIELGSGDQATGIDLCLGPAATISGAVRLLADGSPGPNAVLSCEGAEGLFLVGSEEDGTYRFEHMPPGEYSLKTTGINYMTVEAVATVTAGETSTVDLNTSRLGAVTGTVTDTASRAPLANVPVYVMGDDGVVATEATAADGTYTLRGLNVGTYGVILGEQFSPGLARQEVAVDLDSTVQTVDLEIAVSGIVTGTVFAADGVTPLQNGLVALVDGDQVVAAASTDIDGRYSFVAVVDGTYVLEAGGPDHDFPPITGVALSGGVQLSGHDFTAGSEEIAGTVTDAAMGGALQYVRVGIFSLEGSPRPRLVADARTDAAGHYSVSNLVPGQYGMEVRAVAYATEWREVTVYAGIPADASFALDAQSSISGVVTSAGRGAVARARVFLHPETGPKLHPPQWTDDDGRYSFTGLASSAYKMVVVADGFETSIQDNVQIRPAEDAALDVSLDVSTITVSGTVSSPNGPLPNVLVAAADSNGTVVDSTQTDMAGSFELRGLSAGQYAVEASGPGYLDPLPRDVTVQAGQGLAGVNFNLLPRGLPAFETASSGRHAPEQRSGDERYYEERPTWGSEYWYGPKSKLVPPLPNPPGEPKEGCEIEHGIYSALVDRARKRLDEWTARYYSWDSPEAANSLEALTNVFASAQSARALSWQIDTYNWYARNNPRQAEAIPLTEAAQWVIWYLKDYADLVDMGFFKEALKKLRELQQLLQKPENRDLFLGDNHRQILDYWLELEAGALGTKSIVEFAKLQDGLEDYKSALGRAQKARIPLIRCELGNECWPAPVETCNQVPQAGGGMGGAEAQGGTPEKAPTSEKAAEAKAQGVNGNDPNDKVGPAGYGAGDGFDGFVRRGVIAYEIQFENDPDKGADAPAQEVFITDVLDDDFDLSTLAFTGFGFNNFEFDVPPGLRTYETTIDLRPEGIELLVEVVLGVDTDTRELSATFRSLDPVTHLLTPDPDAGFLPVNDKDVHNGEGYVKYRIACAEATGTQLENYASIVFDTNDPILTPVAQHKIDAEAPASVQVAARKTGDGSDILLALSGDDGEGSGIVSYDIQVAGDERGEADHWATVPGPEALYDDGEFGGTYSFYVRATDGVGYATPYSRDADADVAIPDWAFRLGVENADVTELFVGLDGDATDGWDAGLDEDVPSSPRRSGGTICLDAAAAGHDRMAFDVRAPGQSVEWQIECEPQAEALRLTWDSADVPAGKHMWLIGHSNETRGILYDTFTNLRSVEHLDIAHAGTYSLHYGLGLPPSLPLEEGWNLISLPAAPLDPDPAAMVGDRIIRSFLEWLPGGGRGTGIYRLPESVTDRRGYWALARTAGAILLDGPVVRDATVTVRPGWNLIGVPEPVSLPAKPDLEPVAWFLRRNPQRLRYQPTTQLDPEVGYWIYWRGNDSEDIQFLSRP